MSQCTTCPFNFGHPESEIAQNYGCLPTPSGILSMRQHHGKTWACHDEPRKPCAGAIQHQADKGLPFRVIDHKLLTERSPWHLYIQAGMASPGAGK